MSYTPSDRERWRSEIAQAKQTMSRVQFEDWLRRKASGLPDELPGAQAQAAKAAARKRPRTGKQWGTHPVPDLIQYRGYVAMVLNLAWQNVAYAIEERCELGHLSPERALEFLA